MPRGGPGAPGPPRRDDLALGVLGRLARLLQAVLLALLDPRVAGQEAGLLQRRTVVGLDLLQRTGDAEAQRAGLPGDAAAVQAGDHVVRAGLLERDERLVDGLLVHLVREVLLEGAAVQLVLPRAGHEADADDGLLAAADGAGEVSGGGGHYWATCFSSKGTGACAWCGWVGPA